LKTDRIDLYLLHWRETTDLAQTLEGFAALVRDGKIRHWGVSNFDLDDLQELVTLDGGKEVSANQVMYNLKGRGIEYAVYRGAVDDRFRSLLTPRWTRDRSCGRASSGRWRRGMMRTPRKSQSPGSCIRKAWSAFRRLQAKRTCAKTMLHSTYVSQSATSSRSISCFRDRSERGRSR
jgi:hypothetical protein